MTDLVRTKNKRWIIQKNIQSHELIINFLEILKEFRDINDKQLLMKRLRDNLGYSGRSNHGSESTIGVRLSQMCFYMFGYKSSNKFIIAPITELMIQDEEQLSKLNLINLFSIQYPHPFSKTDENFEVYAGRLFIKLLTDERINKKLYIDEVGWFLPFIKSIDEEQYSHLIESIISFRKLDFKEKRKLFESVNDYDIVFSNVFHEFNYYFLRIFKGLNVLEVHPDSKHNDGKLLVFKHGRGSTMRNDAYQSHSKISGYISLNPEIFKDALKLLDAYNFCDIPIKLSDKFVFSKAEWIKQLYEIEPLRYLSVINKTFKDSNNVISKINLMTHKSIFGSRDGKDFEYALKEVFEIFDDIINIEILSGAGQTDILCVFNDKINPFKFNVDAKTSSRSVPSLNPSRLGRHIKKTGSKYAIVVSPKYSKGVELDILNSKIVTIRAETLATYVSKEFFGNKQKGAQYSIMNEIVVENLGSPIDNKVIKYIDDRYGI